jgi:alanine dehydrogenase
MAQECGDVMALTKEELERLGSARLLADVVVAPPTARHPDEISLFKSIGTAVQDLASAWVLYEAALRQGVGRDLGECITVKKFGPTVRT